MKTLAQLIHDDMKLAFGVTEPGAIAYASARARALAGGEARQVTLDLNSGIYKNAFTCGIPNSPELGNAYAAALGAVGGDPELKLEALEPITQKDNERARELVTQGKVTVNLDRITPTIYIRAKVRTDKGEGEVTIEGSHTNITCMRVNGETVFEAPAQQASADPCEQIKQYTLKELVEYARTVPLEEIAFLDEAFETDLALFEEGLAEHRVPMTSTLIAQNGGQVWSKDARSTAIAVSVGAIEARVAGVPRAAMSITGSGSHGILSMMPLYALCRVERRSREELLRAVCLSCLVTIYIKEYSGRLSALCGCTMAGGTGTACGIVMLRGGGEKEYFAAICNMAASLTGMICHGGNPGCALKALLGIGMAFDAALLAMAGTSVDCCHSIMGSTPEKTMQNMGYVASPGMIDTEGHILEIMRSRK